MKGAERRCKGGWGKKKEEKREGWEKAQEEGEDEEMGARSGCDALET